MVYQVIQQFQQMLKNLAAQLDKAQAFAEARQFDVNNLLNARLAPDMFHFTRQVQAVTDMAKFAAGRLSGQTPPVFEDTETTLPELQARIQKTLDYLASFQAEDFAEAAERQITLSFLPGQYLTGDDYLHQFILPNIYFHLATAYNILRHNGVDLGKRDFIAGLNLKPLKTAEPNTAEAAEA